MNPRLGSGSPGSGRFADCYSLESRPAAGPGAVRRRQGTLLETVTTVLELAGKPLRVREVHATVEELLGSRVPFSSVNEALSTHCSGPDSHFRRVNYGSYAVRSESTP